LRSKVPLLDRIMHYIVHRKGKQVRPMLVLLSASIAGGINEKTYRAASLIELLHTATLVHDDVVDNSDLRRSFFSINALWKNKIAVLVGDYLLSKGLLLSLDNDDFDLLKIVSHAVKELSEGELLQMEKSRGLNKSEAVYLEIIEKKTASLFESSCGCGAASANNDPAIRQSFKIIGNAIGMAFQIKDDLLDLGTDNVGKPTANDIKEKKLTLPVIYALGKCSSSEHNSLIGWIKNAEKKPELIPIIINKIIELGGIEYAKAKMKTYIDIALGELAKFEQTQYRKAFEELIWFVIDRKK
jgi:octaprenyl-diphosphate synthase